MPTSTLLHQLLLQKIHPNQRSEKGDKFYSQHLNAPTGGRTETYICNLQWNDLCSVCTYCSSSFLFLWDYFADEVPREANLFCHNLFPALNLRKLQYLVCFDAILMILHLLKEMRGKVWNKFWYNVIVFIRVFSGKMRMLIIFIARAVGNLQPAIRCHINVNCRWLSDTRDICDSLFIDPIAVPI